MNLELLSKIGLSENEIKVYISLLKLGRTTSTPIVKESKVSNSKVYQTLEKLIRKGLVSYVVKNNRKNFQAAEPKRLLFLLQEKKETISKQEDELNKFLPEIKKLINLKNKNQETTIFEGLEGLESAIDELLEALKEKETCYLLLTNNYLGNKAFMSFLDKFHKKRMAAKINIKILTGKQSGKLLRQRKKFKGESIKFSDQKIPVETFIYKGVVMFLNWDNSSAFVIRSQSNFEHYKKFFEDIWKKAKK
jgi:sugar-specific transcriptional regulator TrmB